MNAFRLLACLPGATLRLGGSAATVALLASAAFPAAAQPALPQLPGGAPSLTAPAPAAQQPVGEPQGAPFPSMVRPGGQAAQRPAGSVPLPLSTEQMTLDERTMNGALGRAGQQVDERLSNLRVGSGQLAPPDTSAYRGELEEMAAIQRQLRLLDLKQKQANAAIALWSTVYDPRREEDAARALADARRAAEAPPPPPAAAAAQAAATQPDLQPFPRVLSIVGTGGSLRATLLVPYTGELQARVGTILPGERRVSSITAEGVTVSDPKMGTVALGYGDSVPLSPPPAVQRQASGPSMPQAMTPMMIPQISPMPQPPIQPGFPMPGAIQQPPR